MHLKKKILLSEKMNKSNAKEHLRKWK